MDAAVDLEPKGYNTQSILTVPSSRVSSVFLISTRWGDQIWYLELWNLCKIAEVSSLTQTSKTLRQRHQLQPFPVLPVKFQSAIGRFASHNLSGAVSCKTPNSCRPLPASPRRTPSVTVGCRGHPKRSCSRCGEESMQAVLIDICIQNCLVLSNHPKISEGLSAHFKCG